ncbi:GvpL/GvpF family gas vesicle protein [Intrasporangium mesophilum]
MLLLYAVVPGRPDPFVTAWAESTGLQIAGGDEVSVVCEQVAERPDASREALLDFGARLITLAKGAAVLPMRYGTLVADESDLDDLVAREAGEWVARLRQVAGHGELIVHASRQGFLDPARSVPPDPAPTGRAYLERRAAEHRAEVELGQVMTDVVNPFCRAVRALRGDAEIRLACLVAQGDQASLRDAVRDWASGAESRAATVTGPFPAFSFAEGVVA